MSAFITRPWKQFLCTVLTRVTLRGLLCARLSSLHSLSHGIIILTPQSMARGAWQAVVHGVAESVTTEATKHSTV